MPPMGTNFAAEGKITSRQIDYYAERAKGGVGLIIVEASCPDMPGGKSITNQIGICSDDFNPGLKSLSQAIQAHGAKAAIQIQHCGLRRAAGGLNVKEAVGPSKGPWSPGIQWGRELTIPEIQALVEKFSDAARRAKQCGFDAVEFHAAHHYLISEFLSPYWNKRTDMYGGNLNGRMKFLLEIISRTKEKVGNDYPLLCRINGDEYTDGGLALEDAIEISKRLEKAGVHAIHVSIGNTPPGESSPRGVMLNVPPMRVPEGCFIHLAAGIKKEIGIPVIAVGRLHNPVIAENVLKNGQADLVAMGRALIADPEIPNKIKEGRTNEIRPCICCNQRCVGKLYAESRISCTINPAAGRENDFALRPAEHRKKVLILGGGPAGMEVGRIAALRGHEIHLWEKDHKLGGQLLLSSVLPGKQVFENFRKFQENELHKLSVNIQLGKEAAMADVQHFQPDVLVIATGSRLEVPEIPGGRRQNVLTARQVLRNEMVSGNAVVVVGGGGVGCETADFLALKGKKVTVVEQLNHVAEDLEPFFVKRLLLLSLARSGVEIILGATVLEILDSGVVIQTGQGRKTLSADTVVMATSPRSNDSFASALKDMVPEVYQIGDAADPRKLDEVMEEASVVGRRI